MENHPRYLEVIWGCVYAGPGLHRMLLAAHPVRAGLHHQRLRSPGLHHVSLQGRPGRRDPLRDARRSSSGSCSTGRSRATSPTRTLSPALPAEPLPDRVAGNDMLYSSGTTGRPKGVKGAAPSEPLGGQLSPVGGLMSLLFGVDAEQRVPVTGPAVPRRPVAVLPGDPRARRHRRGHGALRPRGGARPDRALPRHPQPVGADHVRPDAQAPRRGPRALRRLLAARWRSTPLRPAPSR